MSQKFLIQNKSSVIRQNCFRFYLPPYYIFIHASVVRTNKTKSHIIRQMDDDTMKMLYAKKKSNEKQLQIIVLLLQIIIHR